MFTTFQKRPDPFSAKRTPMDIGCQIRSLREERKLSQGEIEQRTGLLRCYISRVENGHTVPALATLEKLARAMGMPLYQVLYDGNEPPSISARVDGRNRWGESGKDARFLRRLRQLLAQMDESNRELLLAFAGQMLKRKR